MNAIYYPTCSLEVDETVDELAAAGGIFDTDNPANLARYIIRASFSQKRMSYHRESGQVEYRSKDGSEIKVFDALEWMAAMCSHIPGNGEQMARY